MSRTKGLVDLFLDGFFSHYSSSIKVRGQNKLIQLSPPLSPVLCPGTVCCSRTKDCKTGRKISGYCPGKTGRECKSRDVLKKKKCRLHEKRGKGTFYWNKKKNESFIYTCRKKEDFMCVSFKCSLKFINIISLNPFKMWIFMNDHRRNGSGCNPKR